MAAIQNGTSGIAEDSGPRFKSNTSTGLMMFMDIVNTITHLSLGAVSFIVVFAATVSNYYTMNQHMVLCTFGYVLLMSQSILVMSPHNGWSRTIKYQNRKLVHLVMHVAGSILAITGSIIIINEKNVHFNTIHGILGLVALVLTILSLIGGVIHLFTCLPRITCLLHCVIGALTIVVAFLAFIFGSNDIIRPLYGDGGANVLIILIIISLLGTLLPSCLKLQRGCL